MSLPFQTNWLWISSFPRDSDCLCPKVLSWLSDCLGHAGCQREWLWKLITFAPFYVHLTLWYYLILPEIFTGWNLTRYLKGFNNSMIKNLAKLEAKIQNLVGIWDGKGGPPPMMSLTTDSLGNWEQLFLSYISFQNQKFSLEAVQSSPIFTVPNS